MGGSVDGGKLTAKIVKAKYGEDYYRKLGAKGGAAGHSRFLTNNPEAARLIGTLGGRKPRSGRYSLARKQAIIKAKQQLRELNKQRGMV